MRTSANEVIDGRLINGYDYELQVWVRDGIVQDCGHPSGVRAGDRGCCNARRYSGLMLANAQGLAELRSKAEVR